MSDTTPTPEPASSPNLNDEIVSVIRVAAAGLAGFAVAQLVRLGVHVDQGLLVSGFTALFSTGYYAASRYLAKHAPWADRLLLLRNPKP